MTDYAAILNQLGCTVTSRWIKGGHEISLDSEDPDNARFAIEDYEDLMNADTVIHFADEPDAKTRGRGGRHIEFGIALATGKRLVHVGRRENVFHYLPQLECHESFESFLRTLTQPTRADLTEIDNGFKEGE